MRPGLTYVDYLRLPAWCRIGVKCVCVYSDDSAIPDAKGPNVVIGNVVKINWIGRGLQGLYCLGFEESHPDACFPAAHFEPLV